MALEFAGLAVPLTPNDVIEVALNLGVEPEIVWAVCDIESDGSGFLTDGRPRILFEAQVFSRLTGHQYDRTHSGVSSPVWNRGLYGAGGAHQYDRLAEAIALDRRAALNSASWGMFQVLGLNDGQCGYTDVETFVTDMATGERAQLDAFAEFCSNGGLIKYLKAHDWVRFALRYNGAGEAINHYDTKLAAAYAHRIATWAPHPAILARAVSPIMITRPQPISDDDETAALNRAELARVSRGSS